MRGLCQNPYVNKNDVLRFYDTNIPPFFDTHNNFLYRKTL